MQTLCLENVRASELRFFVDVICLRFSLPNPRTITHMSPTFTAELFTCKYSSFDIAAIMSCFSLTVVSKRHCHAIS
jgi:hypothetical protein